MLSGFIFKKKGHFLKRLRCVFVSSFKDLIFQILKCSKSKWESFCKKDCLAKLRRLFCVASIAKLLKLHLVVSILYQKVYFFCQWFVVIICACSTGLSCFYNIDIHVSLCFINLLTGGFWYFILYIIYS